MSTRYPVTYHKPGDTWDRTQLYALPAGTWTATSQARTGAGVFVQQFDCALTELSAPDANGNTHALNTTASAGATELWPLETILCDVVFTDTSSTRRSSSAFAIAVTSWLPPVLDEYTQLAAIPGDLVALLRGEPGEASTVPGPAGPGVPVGGTTGQVLAKSSNTDRDTHWVDQTGGSGGGATNLGYTASQTGGTVTSDTGTDATLPLADGTNAGLMTPAQFAKLAATSGTNTGDQDLSGYALSSHNHTGTYDPAGTAASALSSHTAAGDPHPQYALESALGSAAAASTADFTPAAHAGAGGAAHANAIAAGAAGFMSGADKSKLDGIAAGAQVNPASTDALTEGSTNLYSTAARIRATVLTGLSTATATVVTAAHTILEALGFLQAQVSAKQDTLVSGTNIKTVNSTSLLGSGNITVSASPGGSTTQIQYNNAGALAGASGITTTGTELAIAGGTVTANTPVLNVTQTWNNAAVAFTAKLNNVTNTASATASLIEDWQFNSASILGLRKDGRIILANGGVSSAGPGIFGAAGTTTGFSIEGGGQPTFRLFANGVTQLLTHTNIGLSCRSVDVSLAGDTANRAVRIWGTSVGQAELNDGTTGNFRDLKLRNHIGTGGNVTGMAAKTADYTLTLNDHAATFDASGAARTATLPALSTVTAGQEYIVIKIDSSANALTLDGNAAETINGAASISTTTQWAALRVKANAGLTAWVTF